MATTMTPKKQSKRSLLPKFRSEPLATLREEMEDLFARFWGDGGDGWFTNLAPSVDLAETAQAVEARLDLPGMKPEEIEIQIRGNVLTVSGERKEEEEEKGKTFHRIERRTGSFSRSVTLPSTVNEDEVAAEYRDGVLIVTMPKSEEAKAHKIPIKT